MCVSTVIAMVTQPVAADRSGKNIHEQLTREERGGKKVKGEGLTKKPKQALSAMVSRGK